MLHREQNLKLMPTVFILPILLWDHSNMRLTALIPINREVLQEVPVTAQHSRTNTEITGIFQRCRFLYGICSNDVSACSLAPSTKTVSSGHLRFSEIIRLLCLTIRSLLKKRIFLKDGCFCLIKRMRKLHPLWIITRLLMPLMKI